MKNKQNNSKKESAFNPIFVLIVIGLVFAGLFYFFPWGSGEKTNNGGVTSSLYEENDNWKNSENVWGSQDAPITLVEYGDYQCPACGNMRDIVEGILNQYNGKIRLIYRHYPLSFHKFAFKASIAAECAGEQGKFWEMHDKLYQNQKQLENGDLKKYAGEIGADTERFEKCFDNDGYAEKINKQKEQGDKDNIQGTPAFFINGKELKNAEDERYLPRMEDFKREIDLKLNLKFS